MFALLLPSRPLYPQDAFTTLTPTQFALSVPTAPRFSHIVVFLVPSAALLPPESAAAAYVQFPGETEFRFLGAVGPGKESAIFRVNGSVTTASAGDEDEMIDDDNEKGTNGEAPVVNFGIAILPAAEVAALMAAQQQQQAQAGASGEATALVKQRRNAVAAATPTTTKVLAQRIIKNAFNFLASFSAPSAAGAGEEVVPLKAFRDWWTKFERRIEADPAFLERDEEDG